MRKAPSESNKFEEGATVTFASEADAGKSTYHLVTVIDQNFGDERCQPAEFVRRLSLLPVAIVLELLIVAFIAVRMLLAAVSSHFFVGITCCRAHTLWSGRDEFTGISACGFGRAPVPERGVDRKPKSPRRRAGRGGEESRTLAEHAISGSFSPGARSDVSTDGLDSPAGASLSDQPEGCS